MSSIIYWFKKVSKWTNKFIQEFRKNIRLMDDHIIEKQIRYEHFEFIFIIFKIF